MQSEGLVWLTCILPNPSLYTNPLLPHTLSNPLFPLPKTLWWVLYVWDVVVVEEKRLEAAHMVTSRTYGVFNSIPVYLPHSTIQKLLKLLKIFRYILYTYQNGSKILSGAINVVSCYYGEKAWKVAKISPRHIRSTSYRHPKFMKFSMQAPYTSIHNYAFLC